MNLQSGMKGSQDVQVAVVTAVVTGATGAIGKAIAGGLARAGYEVVIIGRDEELDMKLLSSAAMKQELERRLRTLEAAPVITVSGLNWLICRAIRRLKPWPIAGKARCMCWLTMRQSPLGSGWKRPKALSCKWPPMF